MKNYREALKILKKLSKYKDEEFTVIRNRPSVTQGFVTVKYKDKEFNYGDEIYLQDKNGDFSNGYRTVSGKSHKFYGEVIGGWGSITQNNNFIEATKYELCGFKPYEKADIKEKLEEIIVVMNFAKEILNDIGYNLDTIEYSDGPILLCDFTSDQHILSENLCDVLYFIDKGNYLDSYDNTTKRFLNAIYHNKTLEEILKAITPEYYELLNKEKEKIFGKDRISTSEITSVLDKLDNKQFLNEIEEEDSQEDEI